MGYFGKLEQKLQAQELRKNGLSYGEILQTIRVSKDTISRWCKDIELSNEQKIRLLNNKSFGQKKGSLVAADNKRQERIRRTNQEKENGLKDIGNLSKRESFIIGISLYAAEGNKTDGKGGFTNADPRLIVFMNKWFLHHAKIPLEKLRGSIWLHEGLDEKIAKKYWSDLTGIPLSQFRKTYIAINKKDSRKNIHSYGVFAIRFSDSMIHRRIMGWIYALFNDRISLEK